jgi:hypothetical protein
MRAIGFDPGGTAVRRWKRLSTENRIAIVGLVIALLAAVPSYLALTGDRDPNSSFPSLPSSTAASTSSSVLTAQAALRTIGRYNWTNDSIMWALSGQLPQADVRVIEQPLRGDASASEELESLLAKRGGVKIAIDNTEAARPHAQLRVVLIGEQSTPVLITGMRARILKRAKPLSGTIVHGPPQGEGTDIQVGFDLDSDKPIARTFDENFELAGSYFGTKHVTVKKGEQIVFGVRAFSSTGFYEWEIVVDALVGGKDEQFVVREGTHPFRTTAFAESYQTVYELDFNIGRFVRLPPGSAPRRG